MAFLANAIFILPTDLKTDSCRFGTLGTNQHQIRSIYRSGNRNSLAFFSLPARLGMFFRQVQSFDNRLSIFRHYMQNFPDLSSVLPGQNFYLVVLSYFHKIPANYQTSGANDTIFIKPLSLISLAMGPKIRVPFGSDPSTITAALSEKLI